MIPMNESDTEKLINRLQQLPELEPPPDLINKVMKRIKPDRKPFWQKFLNRLGKPCHITFKPLQLAGTTVFAAALFSLGMLTGINRVQQVSVDQPAQITAIENILQDPKSSFLAGRELMAGGLEAEALPFLQSASSSSPNNPEYAYWEGLCYQANGMPARERSSYIRGINASPDTIPLLLNLGHNFLEQKQLSNALAQYSKVLSLAPDEQTALYNKGLVYTLKNDSLNEITAWKTYLHYYRSGKKSLRAVRRLNNLKDFTYRIYQLGNEKIILHQAALIKMQPTERLRQEVEIVANRLRHNPKLQLDIVYFHKNDAYAARKNALLLKRNIAAVIGKNETKRIRLSWFGEKEIIQISSGEYRLPESLLLFGTRNYTNPNKSEI